MANDPNADLARWAVGQFDASTQVTQTLSRTPLPDGPLQDWALETLHWGASAMDVITKARTQLNEPPPSSAPIEVIAAIRATIDATLSLFDLYESFVAALHDAATDLVAGRAQEINDTAVKSIDHLPWLLLESQCVRFMAGGQTLAEHDLTRWLLLARAHAYAVRRDLEDLERQAQVESWIEADARALSTEIAAMQRAINRGRAIVEAKLEDPETFIEHWSAGDLLRSCRTSFTTLEALAQNWVRIFGDLFALKACDDRLMAIEDACTAFSEAGAELDRELARRAEIMRTIQ